MNQNAISLSGRIFGGGSPPLIIAELSGNQERSQWLPHNNVLEYENNACEHADDDEHGDDDENGNADDEADGETG